MEASRLDSGLRAEGRSATEARRVTALEQLHAELTDVLVRHVEPAIRRHALRPDQWRLTLVCREDHPELDGIHVVVTDDQPAAVAKLLTDPRNKESTR